MEKCMLDLSSVALASLLSRLSSDDHYREAFQNNPASALAESGMPEAALSALPRTCELPQKAALHAAYEMVHNKNDGKGPFAWFLLSAA
jgi:putative modified peptide